MKTKVISILLLLCFCMPIATTYFWLRYRQGRARAEAKTQIMAGLDKKDLTVLKFTEAETKTLLKWEHAHEFEYKNQLYDVVEVHQEGDTLIYSCWEDKKESHIKAQIAQLWQQNLENDTQSNETKKSLLKFYAELFYIEKAVFQLSHYIQTLQHPLRYVCDFLERAIVPFPYPPE